jgi:hypothetical protein
LNYANVAATLALVFCTSAGALAATHYLITSTKQISPRVLKSLRGQTGAIGKTGAIGPPGASGSNGVDGKTGPSRTYQQTDAEQVIPEPKAGLGTPIDSLALPAGTYLVTASGYIEREGLEHGQGALQRVQLRREGTSAPLAEQVVECVLGSTGGSSEGASAAYSITRLVTVSGTAQELTLDAYDETKAGKKSTARGAALTATLVDEWAGAL